MGFEKIDNYADKLSFLKKVYYTFVYITSIDKIPETYDDIKDLGIQNVFPPHAMMLLYYSRNLIGNDKWDYRLCGLLMFIFESPMILLVPLFYLTIYLLSGISMILFVLIFMVIVFIVLIICLVVFMLFNIVTCFLPTIILLLSYNKKNDVVNHEETDDIDEEKMEEYEIYSPSLKKRFEKSIGDNYIKNYIVMPFIISMGALAVIALLFILPLILAISIFCS